LTPYLAGVNASLVAASLEAFTFFQRGKNIGRSESCLVHNLV